jgi:hypothetical protein
MTQRKLSDLDRKDIQRAANAVLGMCDWSLFPEGREYWDRIYESLSYRARYGTTDGKPWVEPELTDEDAKQRPWVKVKSDSRDEWGSFLVRLIYVKPKGTAHRFVVQDPKELYDVTEWSHCRLATPEEIEAANAERQ